MSKNMPYTVERTFHLHGQPYPDEASVLRAAVAQALGNQGVAATVLRECCALAPLLARACELGMGTAPPQA